MAVTALLCGAGGSPCHPGAGQGPCSDQPDRPFGVSDWSPVCITLWGPQATAPGSEHPNKAVWRPECSCLSLLTACCPLLTWSCASLLCVLGFPQSAKGCRSSVLAIALGDARALCSIVWEKPALPGHRAQRGHGCQKSPRFWLRTVPCLRCWGWWELGQAEPPQVPQLSPSASCSDFFQTCLSPTAAKGFSPAWR